MNRMLLFVLLLLVSCGPSLFEREKQLREKEFIQIAKSCVELADREYKSQLLFIDVPSVSSTSARRASQGLRQEISSLPNIRYDKKLDIIRSNILTVADGFDLIEDSPTKEMHADNLEFLEKCIANLKSSMDLIR